MTSGPLVHGGTEEVIISSGGHKMLCVGTAVPTDGTAGYMTGCIFMQSDGGAGTSLYANEGTAASCDFDAISVA